ncbi:MAG: zinc ribbon domain-containing protein [Methanotrichaceae archaeon]
MYFVTYKVKGKGTVAKVDSRYTSKICSRCGLLGTKSRHSFTTKSAEGLSSFRRKSHPSKMGRD